MPSITLPQQRITSFFMHPQMERSKLAHAPPKGDSSADCKAEDLPAGSSTILIRRQTPKITPNRDCRYRAILKSAAQAGLHEVNGLPFLIVI